VFAHAAPASHLSRAHDDGADMRHERPQAPPGMA
jgi:hypothetical protein